MSNIFIEDQNIILTQVKRGHSICAVRYTLSTDYIRLYLKCYLCERLNETCRQKADCTTFLHNAKYWRKHSIWYDKWGDIDIIELNRRAVNAAFSYRRCPGLWIYL